MSQWLGHRVMSWLVLGSHLQPREGVLKVEWVGRKEEMLYLTTHSTSGITTAGLEGGGHAPPPIHTMGPHCPPPHLTFDYAPFIAMPSSCPPPPPDERLPPPPPFGPSKNKDSVTPLHSTHFISCYIASDIW